MSDVLGRDLTDVTEADDPVLETPDALPAPAVARQVATVEDAILELGRVEVFAEAVATYRGRLRSFIAGRMPPGGKWPVEGVAPTVSMSAPRARPAVSDAEAFAEWFASTWPDEVVRRPVVEVVDHARAAGAETFEELRAALDVREETLLPEKALERATRHTRELGDGRYVTTAEHVAGSGVIVDGVAVRPPGEPRLTVRWEPEWTGPHAAALLARLEAALPAVPGEGVGR